MLWHAGAGRYGPAARDPSKARRPPGVGSLRSSQQLRALLSSRQLCSNLKVAHEPRSKNISALACQVAPRSEARRRRAPRLAGQISTGYRREAHGWSRRLRRIRRPPRDPRRRLTLSLPGSRRRCCQPPTLTQYRQIAVRTADRLVAAACALHGSDNPELS